MEGESVRTEDGKVVARLSNGTLYKTGVTEAKHMLKKPPAWCFDVSMFTNPSKEIHTIVVKTDDTHREYSVSAEKFFLFAKKIDRGHNSQYMLPLQYWSIKGNDPEGKQLSLFGEKEKENATESKDNTG